MAVLLPDDVYHDTTRYAKQTHKSLNQVHVEALSEYLVRHVPDKITQAMNDMIDKLGEAKGDPFVMATAKRVLKSVEW